MIEKSFHYLDFRIRIKFIQNKMAASTFTTGSFQQFPSFNHSLPSQSSSDVFNILSNSNVPNHYGSAPNLAYPQQQQLLQQQHVTSFNQQQCCNVRIKKIYSAGK